MIRFGARSAETPMRQSADFSGQKQMKPSGIHSFFRGGKDQVSSSGRSEFEKSSDHGSWTARFLDRVATTSLFMLFFGMPLFFFSLTLQGLMFEKQMYFYFWLLIGLVAWVSRGIVTGELHIRRTPIDIPILIFWAVVGISCFFSVDKWHSLWGLFGDPSRGFLSVTALVLSYFFISSHVTIERFKFFLGGILFSGTLVALWTFLVLLGVKFLPETLLRFSPLSLFGTMKALALFFGMLLPLFILGFVVFSQKFKERILLSRFVMVGLAAGLFMNLYVLVAAYSFTPWLPVLVGVSFFLIFVLAQVIQPGDRWNWMPMTLFVVILAFLMIGKEVGSSLISSKVTILPEVTLGTMPSWSVARDSLKERFILGSGPSTYGYDFSLYKPKELNQGIQNNFRFFQGGSFFLEILPTVGAVGGFFFLVLVLSFLGFGLFSLSHDKEKNKIFSLALWSSSLVFVVALFQMPIDGSILVYGTLIAALAVPILLEEGGIAVNTLKFSLRASPRFALALAFIFMVVSAGVAFMFAFLGKALIADMNAGKANRIMATSEVNDEVLSLMGRSISLVPYEGRYYALFGQMYMSVVNKEASKPEGERNIELIKTLVEKNAVPLVDMAVRRMPNDVFMFEVSGQVYENVSLLAGLDPSVLEKTENVYKRALELEPKNPAFFVKLGLIQRVLANRDDKKDERTNLLNSAKSYFDSSIEEKPDYMDGYLNRALTEEALGNINSAISDFEKSIAIQPGSDNRFQLARILQLRNKEGDLARAEKFSLDILKTDSKNINVLLNLGVVYEKKNEKEKAIETYKKLLAVFEEDDKYAETRKQINTLIENVSSGKGNISEEPSISGAPSKPSTEIPPATEDIANTPPIIPPVQATPPTNTGQ